MGFFDKLRDGLARTKQQLVGRFEELVAKADSADGRTRPVDIDTVEALEELLLSADVGVPATARIVLSVRERARKGESLRALVKEEIRAIFEAVDADAAKRAAAADGHRPHVVLIVGVNGTGKTTTVGKLARLLVAHPPVPAEQTVTLRTLATIGGLVEYRVTALGTDFSVAPEALALL